MDVLVLIDKLDELVHGAKAVPLTDQVRIDREEIWEILDQMRATIPEEIKQARWIVKERQEMLAEAKREAERLVAEARERAAELASQQEVVRQAEQQARSLLGEARRREREVRLGAEDYADEILATLEVNLGKFLTAVQRGREQLQRRSDEPSALELDDPDTAQPPLACSCDDAPRPAHTAARSRRLPPRAGDRHDRAVHGGRPGVPRRSRGGAGASRPDAAAGRAALRPRVRRRDRRPVPALPRARLAASR